MSITAAMVKDLREKTAAGMMDCKKALTECDGDMEKAPPEGSFQGRQEGRSRHLRRSRGL